MLAHQRKGGGIVIKFRGGPLCRLMTCPAIFAKLTFMGILCGVTGVTIFGGVGEHAVDMARLAIHIDM
jgi:hypothetical protein